MSVRPPPFDPLALLEGAVAIPSPSGEEAAVARYLVEAMTPFAEEAFVDEVGNAVAVVGTGPRQITVLGHIDTVAGWVPLRTEGGRLYGRGAVDAKGAFCAAVAAAARLSDRTRGALTLRMIGAVEEEAPSSLGARHALVRYPRPDALIIGEPSGWDAVTLGYKGRLVVSLRASKPDFHSAGEATTAADDVVAVYGAVRAWAESVAGSGAGSAGSGVFDQVQVALQAIRSGGDGLRQWAEATVGMRLPLAWPPPRVVDALAALPRPAGLDLATSGAEHAYRGPRDTPLTRAFRVAIREQGGRPRTKLKTGTSDMNVVAPVWDVPMLAYGPGDSSLDHTPDEHIDLADYDRAVAVLATALERLAAR